MREIFAAADRNYGVPRMCSELRKAGVMINEKPVRRLMRLHGLAGRCIRRRVEHVPGPDGYVIPDLVGRNFAPGDPDHAWCQDIACLGIRVIHATTGEIIRTLTINPERRYHGTGGPIGGPRRPYGPRKRQQPEPQ